MSKIDVWLSALALGCLAGPAAAHAQQGASQTTDPNWTGAVQAAVAADPGLPTLSPADIADFCPGYAALNDTDREAFWTTFMVRLAQAESNGDAGRTRFLLFDRAIHRPAFRRGLFQISIEAAQSERFNCAVTSTAALNDPNANAACAVRIVENTIADNNDIAAGGRYWPSLARADRRHRLSVATSNSAPCLRPEPQP